MALLKRIKDYLGSPREYQGWDEVVLYVLVLTATIEFFVN